MLLRKKGKFNLHKIARFEGATGIVTDLTPVKFEKIIPIDKETKEFVEIWQSAVEYAENFRNYCKEKKIIVL